MKATVILVEDAFLDKNALFVENNTFNYMFDFSGKLNLEEIPKYGRYLFENSVKGVLGRYISTVLKRVAFA